MKKKHLRMFRRILAGTAILTVLVPVRAQVSNPSEWSGFVKGSGNMVVVDTFRMQTFSGAAGDNWEYTVIGETNVSEIQKALVIPLGSGVAFDSFKIDNYRNGIIQMRCAAKSLALKEIMTLRYLYGGLLKTRKLYEPKVDNVDLNYTNAQITGSPYSMEFIAADPAEKTYNGYYLLSEIFAFGQIPQYSLFSGNGNWNDTIRWSHLPPFRHRRALINGGVEINSLVQCNQAGLADGSLRIIDKGHFIVDELFLHNTDISLTVAGELTVNKQITIYYTFPEKGKWYFLSFPFDVSLKGLDPRFQLKDDAFSGNGNYLYVQTYNSDKRASSQQATGNWEVFPMPSSSENPLIFEKGKGYLVALDAAASDNTLTFSVDKENIPDNFGKSISIPINISSSGDADTDHSGWYLCGNPLPAPLELSRIKTDPALDGNIYLYEGNTYKPYPIGSNYALPPFAAFFVKATAATALTIIGELSAANAILLKSDFSLRSELAEPTEVKTQISQVERETGKSFIKGNTLYLDNLPSAGKVKVIDVAGRVVYSRAVPNRSSVLTLSLRSGLYIIIVEAGGYRAQHKCVLTQ